MGYCRVGVEQWVTFGVLNYLGFGLLVIGVMEGVSWKEEMLHAHFNDESEFVTFDDNVTGLCEPFEVVALVSAWK